MSEYFKTHTMYNSKNTINKNWIIKKYKLDLKKYLWHFTPKSNILEIWSWAWNFAYFCQSMWVKNYTWIDIDDYFFEENKKEFPNYKFEKIKFQNFLSTKHLQYDVIFTAHVFEHLDETERIEIIKWIYFWLKNWWIWINYMPNADSFIFADHLRYWDITHKNIYTTEAFEQLLNISQIDYSIEHLNIYIYVNKWLFWRMIHKFFVFITRIYYMWMWLYLPEIYTWEFINIITKK
jgi:hypothetical protein